MGQALRAVRGVQKGFGKKNRVADIACAEGLPEIRDVRIAKD